MNKDKKRLWFLALVLVGALVFSSVLSSAGEDSDHGKSLAEASNALEQELLPLAGAGFVGIAHSEADGEIIVFVEDEQTKQRVPQSFYGYTVRTEVTGGIETLPVQIAEPLTGVSEERKGEVSPLVGGTSLSAYVMKTPVLIYSYAGTLGMVTYDDKILSNAHVIAMNPETGEFLDPGTPIVQPGTSDGGRKANEAGELEAYIQIDFGGATNYADAAIGSIDVDASTGEQFYEGGNYWIEEWTEVSKGDTVRKSGRTTGVTTGEVVHTNVSLWVAYGDQSAYFADQILVKQQNWSFVAPGDSGSAVDKDGKFVGLVFAGSENFAVVCKAEHIINGLGIAVEVPEGRYSLTISSTTGGSVTEPGVGTFIYDDSKVINLVAVPDEHYEFIEWTGDVDEIDNIYDASTTITMKGNYKITANFELEEGWHSLTTSSTVGGEVKTPGEGIHIYEEYTDVELVAEAEEYYHFVEWTGDTDTIGNVTAAETNIIMNDSYSITARFELDEGWYSLTTSSTDGGSVTEPGEGTFIRAANTTVDLEAQADEGYEFVKWTGETGTIADVDAAKTTIDMNSSYTVTAKFESWHPEPIVLLEVRSTRGGSVTSPGEGISLHSLGDEVNLVAEPSEGYQFTHWSGDVDTIADVNAASTTITMDSSYFIGANFAGGGLCFIATAAYGTPMAEEVQILREFRDEYLLTNLPGQVFVDFYYRVSPPIAGFITEHPGLKPIVRAGLLPAVTISAAVINAAPS